MYSVILLFFPKDENVEDKTKYTRIIQLAGGIVSILTQVSFKPDSML